MREGVSIFKIMSTLINVINNVDSENENLSWRKKFRFHNRKLLKFGIFEHKTSIVLAGETSPLFHIICDSEIELKTHYLENAYFQNKKYSTGTTRCYYSVYV